MSQLFREENKPIRELAITPILLSLTCAVFQQTEKFYSKRSKLYEEGLELLLKQWDTSRNVVRDEIYQNLSVERKIELLSYIAVKKFEQEQYVLFEQEELEVYIGEFLGVELWESRSVLKAIESQHGLLIERAREIWSFSHLTFQEYLVAKWFCNKDILQKLSQEIIKKSWFQVALLSVEILENPEQLLNLIKDQADKLLENDENLQNYLIWLNEKTESVNCLYNKSSIKALYFAIGLIRPYVFEPEDTEFERLSKQFELSNTQLWLDIGTTDFEKSGRSFLIQFFFNNELAFILDPSFESDFKYNLYLHFSSNSSLDFSPKLPINIVIDLLLSIILVHVHNLSVGYSFSRGRDLYFALGHVSCLTPIAEFRHKLEEFSSIIPEPFYQPFSIKLSDTKYFEFEAESKQKLGEKWKDNSEKWLKQISDLTIEYSSIGINWNFNKKQIELLKQYCDVYLTLVKCYLSNECNISRSTQKELEETLFLPIAEIEKRKQSNNYN